MEKSIQKTIVCKTWKTKTVAGLIALCAAVALPQVFHLLGMAFHAGSALGEMFLPMHLAIFFVGYLAGAFAGGFAGAFAPLVSYLLTGLWGSPMPALPMLPYMMIELCVYGLVTGLFAQKASKVPVILSLLIAQIAGRAVRALAIVIGFYAFSSAVPVSAIWTSITTGIAGLVLQWVLIPLTMFLIGRKQRRDENE